jgi:hypothetical protein
VNLIREVDHKRGQSVPLVASAEVFEGMGESDSVFEISAHPCQQAEALPGRSLKEGTCWLSLSTRSPKLSLPSTLGTPASSKGHRGVDGSDMFSQTFHLAQLPLLVTVAARAAKSRDVGALL